MYNCLLTGLPLPPCLLYAILRGLLDNEMCWTMPASEAFIEWIYMVPGLACILANFVFFLNIFRILVIKLRAPHANEPAHFRFVCDIMTLMAIISLDPCRKAVKATMVLLPLFGLHWLLTLYRPQGGHCIWLTFYKYLNVSLDGLQGLAVSVAFCYRNAEVRNHG